MGKLLQSKFVITALILVALALWIGRIPFFAPATPTAASDEETAVPDAVENSEEESLDAPIPGSSPAPENNEGFPVTRTNPFLYDELPGTSPATVAELEVPLHLPVVQAISVGTRQPLAVLDRVVVAEGEQVAGWRVDRIEPDVVWVVGVTGRHGLRLSRGSVGSEERDEAPAFIGELKNPPLPAAAAIAKSAREFLESE